MCDRRWLITEAALQLERSEVDMLSHMTVSANILTKLSCWCNRRSLITDAARQLERSKMARFDERSGQLYVTELGRVASHFYIRHASILVFNEQLTRHMDEARVRTLWRFCIPAVICTSSGISMLEMYSKIAQHSCQRCKNSSSLVVCVQIQHNHRCWPGRCNH